MNRNIDPNKAVTWLHLSDLHACNPKTGWEAESILDSLKKDLIKLRDDEGLIPDLIFFTGDAAFGHLGKEDGKSITDQFKEAAKFLDEVRNLYDPALPKENLFLVPGNHDVNRKKVMSMLHDGFAAFSKWSHENVKEVLTEMIRENDSNWRGAMQGLEDYHLFLKENGYNHLLSDPDRLIFSKTCTIKSINVGITGFNSAWSCYKEGQKGNLWLAGDWQILTLHGKVKEAELRIALMHHPFNWFNSVEDPQLAKRMGKHFDFFLHGHEHDEWVTETKRMATTISSGACYAKSAKKRGYNIVQWEPGLQRGNVWLRSFKEKGDGWIAELIHGITDDTDGVWQIGNWDDKPEPKPIPVDKTEILADTPESRGIFGRQQEINDVAAALKLKPMVGLYGMAGIGKSQIIKEIRRLPAFKDMDYVSVLINKDMDLQKLFRQLARALGCTENDPKLSFKVGEGGTYSFPKLKTWAQFSEPIFIHLIDIHHFYSGYKFSRPGIKEFLKAITIYYPGHKIVLESRLKLLTDFSVKWCHLFEVKGIGKKSMAQYFKFPFKDETGWSLREGDVDFIYEWLGGKKSVRGAMPLAMMLLANVAKGTRTHPATVLSDYKQELADDLESQLFNDLYNNVLTDAEQHMLRLCAFYRITIPNHHSDILNEAVGGENIFWHLVQRCLLDTSANEYEYILHAVIAQLTRIRIEDMKGKKIYWDDHDTIAKAWRSFLKPNSQPSLPNIQAANEAFYHLTKAESYELYYELSEKLLDKGVVQHLDQLRLRFNEEKKYKESCQVLGLLVRLIPNDPKYHRFLGRNIEMFKGQGDEEALSHYWKAYRLKPDYPDHLSVIGPCLLARREANLFVKEVEGLSNERYQKIMNPKNLTLFALALGKVGRDDEASNLRQELIEEGINDPIFYNDEAKYLLRKGRHADALAVIRRAEENKCADQYILSVKSSILEKSGDESGASHLRQEQIEAGVRNPVFYNDEARYLLAKGRHADALAVIRLAEENKCTNHHTLSIKASTLEKSGDESRASHLRLEQIDAGVRHPAFYNDEARYLFHKGKYDKALSLIKKVEALGIGDEHTRNIREKIEKRIKEK